MIAVKLKKLRKNSKEKKVEEILNHDNDTNVKRKISVTIIVSQRKRERTLTCQGVRSSIVGIVSRRSSGFITWEPTKK